MIHALYKRSKEVLRRENDRSAVLSKNKTSCIAAAGLFFAGQWHTDTCKGLMRRDPQELMTAAMAESIGSLATAPHPSKISKPRSMCHVSDQSWADLSLLRAPTELRLMSESPEEPAHIGSPSHRHWKIHQATSAYPQKEGSTTGASETRPHTLSSWNSCHKQGTQERDPPELCNLHTNSQTIKRGKEECDL